MKKFIEIRVRKNVFNTDEKRNQTRSSLISKHALKWQNRLQVTLGYNKTNLSDCSSDSIGTINFAHRTTVEIDNLL